MGLAKITMLPLIIMAVLAILSSHVCDAQNSIQDYLDAHNAPRSQVGVGPMKWDATVAKYCQDYVSILKVNCKLVRSGGPYGENLAMSTGDLSGTAAVKLWVNEKQYYHYNSNTCDAGKTCSHYTQVVWRSSVNLGCAKARCNDGHGTVICCNYNPPSKWPSQRPY